METEAGGEEDARGNTDDAVATEEGAGADMPADEEAAKTAAEEADGGSGDCTDGPEAAGASGAAPTADPSAAAAASAPRSPSPAPI